MELRVDGLPPAPSGRPVRALADARRQARALCAARSSPSGRIGRGADERAVPPGRVRRLGRRRGRLDDAAPHHLSRRDGASRRLAAERDRRDRAASEIHAAKGGDGLDLRDEQSPAGRERECARQQGCCEARVRPDALRAGPSPPTALTPPPREIRTTRPPRGPPVAPYTVPSGAADELERVHARETRHGARRGVHPAHRRGRRARRDPRPGDGRAHEACRRARTAPPSRSRGRLRTSPTPSAIEATQSALPAGSASRSTGIGTVATVATGP